MGADGQPQIHVQAYVAMIDFGLDTRSALAMPRWLSSRFALGEPRDTLHIEARYPRVKAVPRATLEGQMTRVTRVPWTARARSASGRC